MPRSFKNQERQRETYPLIYLIIYFFYTSIILFLYYLSLKAIKLALSSLKLILSLVLISPILLLFYFNMEMLCVGIKSTI